MLASSGSGLGALFLVSIVAVIGGIVAISYGLRQLQQRKLFLSRPTSPVGSVPLGPAEVQGHAAASRDLSSPILSRPCVYWRILVEVYVQGRRENQWISLQDRRSAEPFYLQDATGRLLVHPRGARLDIPVRMSVDSGAGGILPHDLLEFARKHAMLGPGVVLPRRMRFTEWTIRVGDPLFVFGTVKTARSPSKDAPSVEEREIRLGSALGLLYISEKSRREVVEGFAASAWGLLTIGPAMILAGILILIVMFG
jgi:hypothetical protein